GAKITVVPGATAVASAMALSGICQPVFTFIGFLPPKNKDREALLSPFKDIRTSLVFYSSPYDVKKDIEYLYSVLGERKLHVVRELTKIHEEHTVTSLSLGFDGEAKGEYVLIVECAEIREQKPDKSVEEQLKELIDGGADKKTAIKQVAKANSLPKDDVYKIALKME
ncbi:MAG: 16S rRNA (cytidine(1402)-2'-O)-methyltransferase, partial [Clostridia bacterium]|nr:16S rRNA (cytidine(1402)-2'-O)-methyltransferase [Clostridia bacterium]